ncbi:MFS transporter [Rhodotorula paludigena]|uniref:MFS transporter n=1 Tax=Rhodotorula paludigena TaxID=86838 RepID=UPI003178A832
MRAAQQALDVEKHAPDPFRAQKDLMEESELPAVPSGLVLARSEDADWLVLTFDKVSSHPDDPLCRSRPWKVWITFVAALLVMLTALPLSLFLLGYVAGPLLWAPLSEAYGRRPFFRIGILAFTAFLGASAASPNYGALLVLRFFTGLAGAVPMTNSGAVCGDIWSAKQRGAAMSLYSVATFAGPALGPIVSSFAASRINWHWAFVVPTILSGAIAVAVVFALPETYAPVILSGVARRLRQETGNECIRSALEIEVLKSQAVPAKARLKREAKRLLGTPFIMMATEPIVAAVAAYMSCCYALIYLLLEGYPVIFAEVHSLEPGYSSLPFLSILVGAVISVPVQLWYQRLYLRDVKRDGRHIPEQRLPPAKVAGPMIVIAFLWLGWTGYKRSIHWIVPTLSGVVQGVASVLIFRAMQTYLIDAYERNAASALTANVVLRSIAGAIFPLFAPYMFRGLGVQWGCTILAGIMLVLCPIPFVFERYGERIRRKSRFAPGR